MPDKYGRYTRRNKFIRGLCQKCYARASAAGDVDEIALPPKSTNSRHRELWSIEVNTQGYSTIKTPGGVRPHHTYVMEQYLGRKLVRGENVHHLNGVRDDNRIENLELWYTSQPYGQRVSDLIKYMADVHPEKILEAIAMKPK